MFHPISHPEILKIGTESDHAKTVISSLGRGSGKLGRYDVRSTRPVSKIKEKGKVCVVVSLWHKVELYDVQHCSREGIGHLKVLPPQVEHDHLYSSYLLWLVKEDRYEESTVGREVEVGDLLVFSPTLFLFLTSPFSWKNNCSLHFLELSYHLYHGS